METAGPIAVSSASLGIVGGGPITYAASTASLASFQEQTGIEPENQANTESGFRYELGATGEVLNTWTLAEFNALNR